MRNESRRTIQAARTKRLKITKCFIQKVLRERRIESKDIINRKIQNNE